MTGHGDCGPRAYGLEATVLFGIAAFAGLYWPSRPHEKLSVEGHMASAGVLSASWSTVSFPETDAIQTLRATKPFPSPRDVAVGVSKCKGIFPEVTQADADSLNQEMAAWDAASLRRTAQDAMQELAREGYSVPWRP